LFTQWASTAFIVDTMCNLICKRDHRNYEDTAQDPWSSNLDLMKLDAKKCQMIDDCHPP